MGYMLHVAYDAWVALRYRLSAVLQEASGSFRNYLSESKIVSLSRGMEADEEIPYTRRPLLSISCQQIIILSKKQTALLQLFPLASDSFSFLLLFNKTFPPPNTTFP